MSAEGGKNFNVGDIAIPTGDSYTSTKASDGYVGIVSKKTAEGMLVIGIHANNRDYDNVTGQYEVHPHMFNLFKPTTEQLNTYLAFLNESHQRGYNQKACAKAIGMINAYMAAEAEGGAGKEPIVKVTKGIYVQAKDHDPKVIEEMIAMVDQRRLRNLFAIAGSSDGNKKNVNQESVRFFLEKWAHAKYGIFLAFGKRLFIESGIDIQINDNEMEVMMKALKKQFPRHAPLLNYFSGAEFMKNQVGNHPDIAEYIGDLKSGMALTKFFAGFCGDAQFDTELSKVLQARTIKGSLVISLDPYDYMTASLNQHNWNSCHSIAGGAHAAGGFAYMMDESSLVAFKHNNRMYNYNVYGFQFEGNSKAWRQMVHIDQHSCAAVFSREYPRAQPDILQGIRELYEATISGYLGIRNSWVKGPEFSGEVRNQSDAAYLDMVKGTPYISVKPKFLAETIIPNLKPGAPVYCVYCLKKISGSGNGRVSCGNC